MLVELPNAHVYFDVAFVVVLTSLMIQGWTIPAAARRLDIAFARNDPITRRVELDLPGQLALEIVGYRVAPNSPYLRRNLIPNWAKPTLVVREERILTPVEADPVRTGDYVYLLAPPEKARALDRFFVNMPPPAAPDPELLGDFFVTGDHTLGELAEIYGLDIAPEDAATTLADFIAERAKRSLRQGAVVPLGPIALVAHRMADGKVTSVGLRLAEPEPEPPAPATFAGRIRAMARRALAATGFRI
jgi:cell volume regulation protein A